MNSVCISVWVVARTKSACMGRYGLCSGPCNYEALYYYSGVYSEVGEYPDSCGFLVRLSDWPSAFNVVYHTLPGPASQLGNWIVLAWPHVHFLRHMQIGTHICII